MSVTFAFHDQATFSSAYRRALSVWDFAKCGVLTIVDRDTKRSSQQNRLMWMWIHDICDYTGDEPHELHERLKNLFAKPIFMRDDESYNDMVLAVRDLNDLGMTSHYERISKKIIELTSTTKFSVKQMAEYLDKVSCYGVSKGVGLRIPADMRWMDEKVPELKKAA